MTNLMNNSDSSSEKTPKVSASYLEDNALTENLNSGSTTVKKTYHHVNSFFFPSKISNF